MKRVIVCSAMEAIATGGRLGVSVTQVTAPRRRPRRHDA